MLRQGEPDAIFTPPETHDATSAPDTPPSAVPDAAQSPSLELVVISGEIGNIIDTVNPNEVSVIETRFSDVRESPAKMYTADAMEQLQLEKDWPMYGPHWALAKVAAFSAHCSCDYFTNFASLGCEGSTKSWTALMSVFFSESNHDINRNRIQFRKDAVIGQLIEAVFAAYDITIAALARKKTLVEARKSINEGNRTIDAIANNPLHSEDYRRVEYALLKGCESYQQREDAVFWANLQGVSLNSLGANAAVSALGLSSLGHLLNCYICNSFGSRIQIENRDHQRVVTSHQKLRAVQSTTSIRTGIPLVL
jgi:hypothetical protein